LARMLRFEFEGALYHIINRGVGSMMIFHMDKDWQKFLVFIERVIRQFNWKCHVYCLMGNHYHLLIETPHPNLSMESNLEDSPLEEARDQIFPECESFVLETINKLNSNDFRNDLTPGSIRQQTRKPAC